MRELEEALGVALFERDGRGIRVTRHGEIFLAPCRRGGHRAAGKASIRSGATAQINAASRSASARCRPCRRASCRSPCRCSSKENTGAAIKIVTGENAVLLDQLRVGALDLVVGRLAAPGEDDRLLLRASLFRTGACSWSARGHPLLAPGQNVFARLGDFPVLMPTRESVIRPFVDRFFIANGMTGIADRDRDRVGFLRPRLLRAERCGLDHLGRRRRRRPCQRRLRRAADRHRRRPRDRSA